MYCLHSGWHVSGTAYCSFLSHFTSFEHRIHFERCSRGDSNFQLNVYVRSNTQLGVRPTASYSGSSPKVDEYITYMGSYRGATWCDHVSKMLLLFENPALTRQVSLCCLSFLKLPWQRLPGLQWYVGAFKVQQSEAMGLMVRKKHPWATPKSSNKKQAIWTIETRSKPSWHHDMTSHDTDWFFHVSLYWCFLESLYVWLVFWSRFCKLNNQGFGHWENGRVTPS